MKRLLRTLITLIILITFFLLGFVSANKSTINTKSSWNEIEKYFLNLDSQGLVKNTSVNNKDKVSAEFETIIENYQISKIDKIIEKRVVATSFAVLSQNNNQNTEYSILRVNFSYTTVSNETKSAFLYFYFYKVGTRWLSSDWSLFEILTEENVTIK